jgi:hypothetical protein
MNGNKDKGDADIRHDFPGGWLLMKQLIPFSGKISRSK